jgi:hypothetical protein
MENTFAPDYSDFTREENLWDEILPNLWQGGTHDDDEIGDSTYVKKFAKDDASFITIDKFDTVITMYQYANPVGWFVKELRYCVYDSEISELDETELFSVVRFAHAEWKNNKKVLIRCQAGLNRSSLVTALVLIREGYEPADAVNLIRTKRLEYCLFNEDFERYILEFDPSRIRD